MRVSMNLNLNTWFFVFLLYCFFSVSVSASSILGEEPKMGETKKTIKPLALKQQSPEKGYAITSDYLNKISIQLGLAFDSYKLSGSGFNVNLAPKRSKLLWGLEYERKLEDLPFSLYLKTRNWAVNYIALPSLSPPSVDVKKSNHSLGSFFQPWEDPFSFLFGLRLATKNVTQTEPNAIMVTSRKIGFEMGAKNQYSLSEDFSLEVQMRLFFPFYFKEHFKNTGFYTHSYSVDGHFALMYSISEMVLLGIKPWLLYERVHFEGVGLRGVTNARETDLTYAIPLELQVLF